MSHILIDHLTQAASFYRGQLRASTRAVAYLKSRGLRGDIAARYGLGYAPAGFQALREAFPNYNDRALEKAGLVAVNDGGRRYDRFRDRIMFPILDDAGSVIGRGAARCAQGASEATPAGPRRGEKSGSPSPREDRNDFPRSSEGILQLVDTFPPRI